MSAKLRLMIVWHEWKGVGILVKYPVGGVQDSC